MCGLKSRRPAQIPEAICLCNDVICQVGRLRLIIMYCFKMMHALLLTGNTATHRQKGHSGHIAERLFHDVSLIS